MVFYANRSNLSRPFFIFCKNFFIALATYLAICSASLLFSEQNQVDENKRLCYNLTVLVTESTVYEQIGNNDMRIKTPITKSGLKTHFTYHFWKYLLAIIFSVFGWNLLYSVTAYRSPENKRIDLYIQSLSTTEERVGIFLKPIWEETVPEMETVDAVLLSNSADDYYTSMQLTTYIMAQEGDIYLLTANDFKTYASQGAFIDLKPYIDSGMLNVDGIDLSAGYIALENRDGIASAERTLCGIPAASLFGLMNQVNIDNRNLIMAVTVYSGNEENVVRFMNGLIEAGHGDPPDGLVQ